MKKKLHFSGPVLTASGYGVHARQLLRALHNSGEFDIAVESLRWGETPFLNDPELEWIRELAARPQHERPDVSIQVTIPNEFKRKAPLTIGVTAGIEVDRVSPHWILKCNQEVDVVVVPSEHSRVSFMVEYQGEQGQKLRLEKPIFVIPEGVDTAVYHPMPVSSQALDELGVPPKNFVFTGLGLDKPNGRDRKNVSRLIEYFCKTFAGNRNVGLVLKLSIVNGSTVDFEIVKRRVAEIKKAVGCGDFPKIFIVHGRMPDFELSAIYNDPRVVAAISLTHGEGFGLPLIEAAATGLPVMATNWSGHLDFLTKDGRKLFVPLEYDLTQVEDSWDGVIEAGTNWATVREADVSTKLQKMVLSSDTPRKWAQELSQHIATKYSLETTGELFLGLVRRGVAELDSVKAAMNPADALKKMREGVREKGPSLVYTMPMSAGDVFLSTGVISALRRKHPGHRVYLATSKQYFDIVAGLDIIDEVIEWQPWMQDASNLEQVFDVAYTPNMNVQMQWANWIHGGKGRNLIEEFAAQCDIEADRPVLPETVELTSQLKVGPSVLAVHAGGQKSARLYTHWTELVKNLRDHGVKVVQVGAKDDVSIGEVDLDLRGTGGHQALVDTLRGVDAFLGIDSYPMHVAAAIGKKTIALFGSSYPKSTGPLPQPLTDFDSVTGNWRKQNKRLKLIETEDRNGCERACYKDTCRVDAANPCINNISPAKVMEEVLDSLELMSKGYKEHRPKIAGYTHILNPKTHGYPFVESVLSMMDFCDEVVVVDGGSTDGSVDELRSRLETELAKGRPNAVNDSCKLNIITREWDPDEPGMDGMQKAFGRAMVSPDVEFLWQQDADEIVHEDDYRKIVDLCKRFPADVDLVHLPVVELWGDDRHARTDRHSWKWRISRNNLRITHGIADGARLTDPKTGRIYAKPGMSDGCEYIDIVTGQHLPHRGFYTKELEQIRDSDPVEYGRIMNEVYSKLPSVWHYSWADLPRKVRNFRDFWDKQWQVLYQTPAEPRFPDVVSDEDILRKAEELRQRGGEHGQAHVFELTKTPPRVMRNDE